MPHCKNCNNMWSGGQELVCPTCQTPQTLITGVYEIPLTEGEEFVPDSDKTYKVVVDDTEYVWDEVKLHEFLQNNDIIWETCKTIMGDQEIVWYDKDRRPENPQEYEITINGPGPNCGCREFNFPKVKPVIGNIDYIFEREQ